MSPDQTRKTRREPGAPESVRVRGRSALLAHAMAQRENRLSLERRDAKSRLEERSSREEAGSGADPETERERPPSAPRPAPPASSVAGLNRPKPKHALIAEALAARTPPAKPSGLDAMVAEALGKTASRHQHDGGFDREAALTDLIARNQVRLGTAGPGVADSPAPPSEDRPRTKNQDREAAIAAAMRTHRERQGVFEDLTVRQRATLRAAAEAMVDRAEPK